MTADNDFYKKIFDKTPEGIAICDANNKIIDVNQNFEQISGFTKEELIEQDINDFLKLSKTKEDCDTCKNVGKLKEPENKTYQLGELLNKENQLSCVRINQSKTDRDNIIYLVIPFSNIAFLDQAHIDFVSTVSHELRTPLTSIKGFADTLLSAGDNLGKEQQRKFIGIIKSQIDRLTRLVENLLTVSKLEAKSTKTLYKAVELKKLIDSVIYSVQHKAQAHTIEINILPNLPNVWADSDKLEQVMMNLIDNAIKYSKPGTTVSIDAKFLENNIDNIEIRVKDEGVGIPKESLNKIFTKFSRIDNPLTREVQGTGLGLYITKSLVTSMNGDIRAESHTNGSTFVMTLPAVSAEIQTKQRFMESN